MGWLHTSERPRRQWEKLVEDLAARNGTLELGFPGTFDEDPNADIATDDHPPAARPWRVRLLALRNGQWVVERPNIAGQHTGGLIPGAALMGVIVRDARRWSFRTSILRSELYELNRRNRVPALRLAEPRDIGTAQRRRFYRVSTLGSGVAPINIWPLLDAESCVVLEDATQLLHLGQYVLAESQPPQTPSLADGFTAKLVDVSAGGVALCAPIHHADAFERHDLFWLELMLPTNEHPLLLAAQPVHVRADRTTGLVHVGMSFSHTHNPGYERFVQENLCQYTTWEQRRQLQRTGSR